ncbi:MAG: sigma-54-dependent Fis family transcriptional regulator [Deltaproteobacteria bacterium]|nr:sigma-54-dependent Fis family transcriptional regulator [Deltaproteobacteria bacterium]
MPEAATEDELVRDRGTRVLVVDDEASLRRTLARLLMTRGFEVLTAEDGESALALLANGKVDVMLLDVVMPLMTGMQVLQLVRQRQPDVEIIMMTGHADVATAVRAVKNGAYDFLTKPFPSTEAVLIAVAKAAERKRLIDKTRLLEQQLENREQFGEMVGSSSVMRQVYRLALGVAPTSTSVLILGESGTGKELVARAVHQHSQRMARSFVTVNCSAIPVELVESELFGHVRGAFTGAMGTRAGLFETADKGTLFLDEIADLPPAAQVKLLRALQSGEIKPVGSDETKVVDVRVVAATNVDLKKRVDDGLFREDLYYRLNVIAIHVPPLRKRKDDIPLLAYHFMNKYAKRMGREIRRISPEALRLLREQPWQGNVRELENAIEHAVVLARGDAILPADLPFGRGAQSVPTFSDRPPLAPASPFVLPAELGDLPFAEAKKRAVLAFEKSYIETMLERTGGNISEAARQSGLDRSNFRRVIKKNTGRKKEP